MGCFGEIYRCAFSQVEEVCHIFERSEGDAGIYQWGFGERSEQKRGSHWDVPERYNLRQIMVLNVHVMRPKGR